MRGLTAFLAASAVVMSCAKPIAPRDSKTAVVNFANDTGIPEHLASGLLYGVPDAKDQIPVSSAIRCIEYTNARSHNSSKTSATTTRERAVHRFQLQAAVGYGGWLSTRYEARTFEISFFIGL